MVLLAAVVASALICSFFCSLSEAVLLSLRHAQIESLGKSRAADILRDFKREIDVPIAAILVLNTIAATMGAAVASAAYVNLFGESTILIFSAAFTFAILVFSEIVPKTLGVVLAGHLAAPVAYGVLGLTVVFKPILAVTTAISGWFVPKGSVPVTSLEEIRLLAALGQNEGDIGVRVASMIQGAATLRELKARDVMVPRGAMVYLCGRDSLEKTLKRIRLSGHSRFPFSYTGDQERIDGVVVVKDLMFQLHETPEDPHWENLLAKPLMIPSATPLEDLLRRFQDERRHLAIVLDEYGGTQGLITLEDVLEEIVGEIEDESDRVNRFIIRRKDGSVLCRGWAEARKVLDFFEIEDEVESVSIGGFVADLVGRVPRVGDVVLFKDLEMRVIQASPRRAERIEVKRVATDANS